MTWSEVKKTLTTLPPPRSPSPNHPLFTRSFFSTKSFGPGQLVGATILVLGIGGLMKFFIDRGRAETEADRARRCAEAPRPPPGDPGASRMISRASDNRGQYGTRP